MLKNVELRKLPAGKLCSIAAILETNNDWKKVMSLVPRNPRSDYFVPKYNNEHIKQIEDHARVSNRKCAEILFEEWGTSGRIRPTLGTLRDVVAKAGIYRAADEIAEMLEEQLPQRPSNGPAALIDTDITLMMQQSSEQMVNGSTKPISDAPKPSTSYGNKSTKVVKSASDNLPNSSQRFENLPDFSAIMPSENSVDNGPNRRNVDFQESFPNIEISLPGIDTDILQNDQLIHFPYRELEVITKKFSEKLIYTYTPDSVQSKLAGKIGSGGFGDVFVGYHPNHGHLAVKKARPYSKFDQKPEMAIKFFNAEVRFLSQLRHKNIVPILGFSNDGNALCVVCEYVDGGSLEQKLAAKILTEKQRINIMIGTAEGLKYLHGNENPVQYEEQVAGSDTNQSKMKFIHGDIKTANILLTRDCVPKLCDFGLAKQIEMTKIASTLIGTQAYMAPEAFSGTITQQNDIFGFGIVLLELLTGLKPIVMNQDRETINIKEYIEESCANNEITTLLDPFIDKWTKGKEIYTLAKTCLVRDRKKRPTAKHIYETLYKISEEAEKESANVELKTPSPYQLLEEKLQSG